MRINQWPLFDNRKLLFNLFDNRKLLFNYYGHRWHLTELTDAIYCFYAGITLGLLLTGPRREKQNNL